MRILSERVDLIEGFPAVDLSTAANNGDYIALKNTERVAVVFVSGVGTAGDDPTLTIEQAQDVSGTGVKALDFTVIKSKQAAADLSAVAKWTIVNQAADNTYTNATAAEDSLIWVVEFELSDLDVENGFDCLRATVAKVGTNPQPGYLMYLVQPQLETSPDDTPSYIVD